MTRRGVTRLLLVVLVGLAGALIIRSCAQADTHEGVVHFGGGWDVDDLRHDAFRLDRPMRLAVRVVGSFETDSALAAYGWVVRREDRAVVWQMTPEASTAGRGSLAVTEDTLVFEAGTYDAYFASYGDPSLPAAEAGTVAERVAALLRFGNRAWKSDKSKWAFDLTLVEEADQPHARRLTDPDDRDATPRGSDLLWAGGPAGHSDYLTYGFQVAEPLTLRLEALGEFTGEPADYAWLDDLSTGRRVWTMTEDDSEPAGGAAKNRRFSGTLTLAPGLYRAVYQTDRSHDADRWSASPPLDPAAYGLFLYTETPDRAAALDPWTSLPRLVEMTGIGDGALETATFVLEDSVRIWAYAVGEMGHGSPYDYAWLIRGGETVWMMDYDETRNAGGAERNRVAEAYLALAPGAYTLHFKTDDTHSPERWRGSPPHHPERWGVTLFALSPDFAPVAVVRSSEREEEAAAPVASSGDPVELPIRLAPLGADQEARRTFTLDRETPLRVYAVGEIIRTDRYDYGWITDDRAEEIVWEMTSSNTEPAGGVGKNRTFKGTITLPAGTYTVHFTTDDSHGFGDFEQGAPADPSAWGITVERAAALPDVPEVPAPPAPPAQRQSAGVTGA